MDHQVAVDESARVPEHDEAGSHEVLPDLAYKRLVLVNVMFVSNAQRADRSWVLIDAGVPGTTHSIALAAEKRFGKSSRPAAIVMTHGHFDHTGALKELAERWDAPVYAHELELPFLNGTRSYPPPDPAVGGGIMATLSRFYPRGPVDVADRLRALPADGSVPGMPGWRWIHTPGHTEGHVSFWRAADRTLIAGDAFVTTKQESVYAVATQEPELHGPPMYFTPDWDRARESVQRLARLEPELAVTGHGRALGGTAMRAALHTLADRFDDVARPKHGWTVEDQPRERG
jgi:glyoxylase-like metal-dependent hydrolase (beta-lactamase superfamily II)